MKQSFVIILFIFLTPVLSANEDDGGMKFNEDISRESVWFKEVVSKTKKILKIDNKYNNSESKNKTEAIRQNKIEKELQKTIKTQQNNQLKVCSTYLKANKLTTGKGGNALDCYSDILRESPDSQKALLGIKEIEQKYFFWVRTNIDRGNYAKARVYLKKVDSFNPDSSKLLSLKAQLEEKVKSVETENAIKKQEVIFEKQRQQEQIIMAEQQLVITSSEKFDINKTKVYIASDLVPSSEINNQHNWLYITSFLVFLLLPSIIAYSRNHPSKMGIFLTNIIGSIFFGIGWLFALIWSLNNSANEKLSKEKELDVTKSLCDDLNNDKNHLNKLEVNHSTELKFDKLGYDQEGFDISGFDVDGFDRSDYNKNRYDKQGLNRGGFNKDGFNRSGWNAGGVHIKTGNNYNTLGFDKSGYNKLHQKENIGKNNTKKIKTESSKYISNKTEAISTPLDIFKNILQGDEITFTYYDKKNNKSNRKVTFHQVYKNRYEKMMFSGYCHLRGENRTFYINSIDSVLNISKKERVLNKSIKPNPIIKRKVEDSDNNKVYEVNKEQEDNYFPFNMFDGLSLDEVEFLIKKPFEDIINYPYGFDRSGDFSITDSEILRKEGKKIVALKKELIKPKTEEDKELLKYLKNEINTNSKLEFIWEKYISRLKKLKF